VDTIVDKDIPAFSVAYSPNIGFNASELDFCGSVSTQYNGIWFCVFCILKFQFNVGIFCKGEKLARCILCHYVRGPFEKFVDSSYYSETDFVEVR
jgi:hypothetical protein